MVSRKTRKSNITEDEFLKRSEEVRANENDYAKLLRASGVKYDPNSKSIIVWLPSGNHIGFRTSKIPELKGASTEAVSKVRLSPFRDAIMWDDLDVSYTVAGLLSNIAGANVFMKHFGRKGGMSKSPAKVNAAKMNGRLGGRPKGKTVKVETRKRTS